MTVRYAASDNVPGLDEKIAAVAAEVTGHDPGNLAYVLIVSSFDDRGQSLFANTPDPMQAIALMLAVLHTATRPWITGEAVEIVPAG